MEKFETLINQQRTIIRFITNAIPNFKKLGKDNMTYGTTERRIKLVQEQWTKVEMINAEIESAATEEIRDDHPYFVESCFDEAMDTYLQTLDFMNAHLVSLTPNFNPLTARAVPESLNLRSLTKLPSIELPKFGGSYIDWETFRDRFKSLILNDLRLTNFDRMHYLCSALSGEASDAIRHLSITADNFPIAWHILTSRFENKRLLVDNHLKVILDTSLATSKSLKGLCSFRDKFNTALQALKNLGIQINGWDPILVYLAKNKLDTESRKVWESKQSETVELITYSEFDKFIQSRVRMYDAMNPVNSQTSDSSKSRITSHATTTSKPICPVCQEDHVLSRCSVFLSYDSNRRSEIVKENHRCFNCLANHLIKDCPSKYRCRECQSKHHTLLHHPKLSEEPRVEQNNMNPCTSSQTKISSLHSTNKITSGNVMLATARVKVYSQKGRSAIVRALLDQGSEATLMTESLAQTLRLPRSKETIEIVGALGTTTKAHHVADIRIGSVFSESPCSETSAIIAGSLTAYIPPFHFDSSQLVQFQQLPLADPDLTSLDPFEIIIGSDLYGSLLLNGVRHGQHCDLTAQQTIFGWIISGRVTRSNSLPFRRIHHMSLTALDTCLRQFWEIESFQEQTFLSPAEQKCENHFKTTHSRNPDGKYIVRLPFQSNTTLELGDSLYRAQSNLRKLESRLSHNSELPTAYTEFLKEYESLGHMTRIVDPQNSTVKVPYYIPHHAVFRDSSATTKLRVVFNASSPSSNGNSLNDLLLAGPKLQTDLTAVILRWRQFKYVYTADIAKMYRQILIHPLDADYQRILWRQSPQEPIIEYKLNTVTYGTSSAPFLALRVLKQLAIDEGSKFPLAIPVLDKQTYVDDCIFGANDEESARNLRNQLITILNKGGFRLRKWASNNQTLLSDIDESDHGLACPKNLTIFDTLKILGISWYPDNDIFRFNISCPPLKTITKRTILSTIAQIFDPFGWITPVVITAKILIQRLWKLQCDWDDALPFDIIEEWKNYHSQLPNLEKLIIPRWTKNNPCIKSIELHGFADASTKAYAAVVYLRISSSSGQITITMLMAKSKVAPVKTISLPRLELCAAYLLSKLMKFIQTSLQFQDCSCYCWSDSTIILEWIRQSPSRWTTFVANRVSKIQECGSNFTWLHVPTEENPADCASRGINPTDIISHNLWWYGPDWLKKSPNQWPQTILPIVNNPYPEQRNSTNIHLTSLVKPWDLQFRYSSWFKLLRVTAFIFRFVRRIRRKEETIFRSAIILHPNEIAQAKVFWIKRIQLESFTKEISSLKNSQPIAKSSPLISLVPFLDSQGLLRAKGRLKNSNLPFTTKYPIILKSHPTVHLIITEIHKNLLHSGSQLTLAHLRQEFWILRARPLIRSILYRCIPCIREKANIPTELMGDLPSYRVTPTSTAFVHTGLDYAGPILVRTTFGRGHRTHKAYIVIFICMTTKAIHLELVSSYSTPDFIAAYHRFISRRGLPSDIYSDNGTTFQGANRELTSVFQASLHDDNFVNNQTSRGVTWHFIPPAAPHFGGLWEAAVKSVKYHLRRCIGSYTLSYDEMITLLYRIEACLNSRPILPQSDNLDDYRALTPGHFLIGRPLVSSPETSVLSVRENRLSRWQIVQRIQEGFWKVWQNEYLHTLQQRPKWRTRLNLAKPGRLVLMRDSGLPPSRWTLGRITKCHPGDDGLTRVVTIKTSNSEFKRPISKVCFLPSDINYIEDTESPMAGGEELNTSSST